MIFWNKWNKNDSEPIICWIHLGLEYRRMKLGEPEAMGQLTVIASGGSKFSSQTSDNGRPKTKCWAGLLLRKSVLKILGDFLFFFIDFGKAESSENTEKAHFHNK